MDSYNQQFASANILRSSACNLPTRWSLVRVGAMQPVKGFRLILSRGKIQLSNKWKVLLLIGYKFLHISLQRLILKSLLYCHHIFQWRYLGESSWCKQPGRDKSCLTIWFLKISMFNCGLVRMQCFMQLSKADMKRLNSCLNESKERIGGVRRSKSRIIFPTACTLQQQQLQFSYLFLKIWYLGRFSRGGRFHDTLISWSIVCSLNLCLCPPPC